jgi:hypothetical protein
LGLVADIHHLKRSIFGKFPQLSSILLRRICQSRQQMQPTARRFAGVCTENPIRVELMT